MKIEHDKKKNDYIDLIYADRKQTRLTFVPGSTRGGDKDWAGMSVIRVQSYGEGNRLIMGPEIPLGRGLKNAFAFIEAFSHLARGGEDEG